jgi:lambda family phage tail tape measure protein
MLQKLMGTAAEFKTITIEAIQVTENQATAFDGVKDAAAGYLESIGTMRDGITNLAGTAFKGLEDALTSLVTTGKGNFLDFARTILQATARMIIQQTILRSIMQAIGAIPGGALPTSPFGGAQVVSGGTGIDGSAFGAAAFSKSLPFGFAKGGVVNNPTMFAYANGGAGRFGLMGEAGPEAIMPLKRGPGGRLGVESSGGVGNIVVNVDAQGTQVEGDQPNANRLGEALGAAVRAELLRQKRPGGLLS